MVPDPHDEAYIPIFPRSFRTVGTRPWRGRPVVGDVRIPRDLTAKLTESMKIHEYQAKELFRQAGVPVLDGIVARTPDEAVAAYDKLGGKIAVVNWFSK